ncbi:NYN domain-containing protein [Aquibium sp. ELW1220]|uniref:NYN domain-containing protein n=1 Tax=Aquibium sp. ELW1220 TaxID=2976766 RepID=UPI0025AFE0C7|nr:NYN domain-containing protein [Aquibium sp. ELW1220]MDN2580351.1 NYN domain-containing protein [Aquibium sp. ELW1220]
MASPDRSPRLAVLIDADNASAKIAGGLFEEIAKIGEASVRRIYGDFSSSRSKAWIDVLAKHAIVPHQQFAYTTGKNASDITLVIDAMDLLHTGRFDGFCLVSSDSDFTRLASRIREQGIDVFGFGEQKTPESFRQACRRFIYTENLLPGAAADSTETSDERPSGTLQPPSNAVPLIRRVLAEMESADGWAYLGGVGTQLVNRYPDFDPRSYGFRKLSDLVRKTEAFDVEQGEDRMVRIRLRKKAAAEDAVPVKEKTGGGRRRGKGQSADKKAAAK